MGLKTGLLLFSPTLGETAAPLPTWTLFVALVLAPLGYMVRFQADPKDAVPIMAICAIAFAGARFGSQMLGVANGAFGGAMAVGIASGLCQNAPTFSDSLDNQKGSLNPVCKTRKKH